MRASVPSAGGTFSASVTRHVHNGAGTESASGALAAMALGATFRSRAGGPFAVVVPFRSGRWAPMVRADHWAVVE